jgi:aerobic-type carbon monoxide dehydrogenase small subunit (CoxS/CutS family)
MDHESTLPAAVPRSGPGFARREFLKGTGAAVAATAIATQAAEAQEKAKQKSSKVAKGPTKISLNINGKATEVTAEPRETLLDVLRNKLNLTGAKDLGDNFTIGADTVLLDGKPVFASHKLAVECTGAKITTVESLHSATKTDPVVTAFCKHDAMQCGFCTPGFVMAVRGFLNQNPKATLDDCRKGLGGNVCRCGTYDGILHAAFEVAQKRGA